MVGSRTEIMKQLRQTQKRIAGAKRRRDKIALESLRTKMERLERELKYTEPY